MASLIETDAAAWRAGMADGFGLGPEKMDELRELYKDKAAGLAKYYDDEAIVAVYKKGLEDAGHGRS